MINIFSLDECPVNSRNGTYGGKAGDKEGITLEGAPWIVKYPKSTKGMRGALASYTTSPLSEYIGSHVYQILGIEAHETRLGIRNGKLVVACKDFCKTEGSLREIRTIKNIYNKELAEQLETCLSSTSGSHLVEIKSILIHLTHNPILKQVPEIRQRFWEQILVDVLIKNNDRNSGNWGVLFENDTYRLAPVFDNGAAFSNKLPDYKLTELMDNPDRFRQSLDTSRTIYQWDRKPLMAKNLISITYRDFQETAENLVPIIEARVPDICAMIDEIPERVDDIPICSPIRKKYYKASIQERLNAFLRPILQNNN